LIDPAFDPGGQPIIINGQAYGLSLFFGKPPDLAYYIFQYYIINIGGIMDLDEYYSELKEKSWFGQALKFSLRISKIS
jgi:hypothetical protein